MSAVNLGSRLALAFLLASASAAAQETVLYTFAGSSGNTMPASGLVMDAEGNLFGTTVGGPEDGIVFELSPVSGGWTEREIYEYVGVNGDDLGPTGNIAIDKAGNLYWSTPIGGIGNCGYVYELVRESGGSWSYKAIHTFAGPPDDGCSARGGLVIDSQGNLFGTVYGGGKNAMGTVFELSPNADESWSETTLWNFSGNFSDGQYPLGTLVLDASGNIYGTTATGGKHGGGTVYEVKPSGTSSTETVLYSFGTNPDDGGSPEAGLIFDKAGNLYGTTAAGEGNSNGVVFELLPGSNGTWSERILHHFVLGTPDGNQPEGSLVFDSKGNLYGTTAMGGVEVSNFPASGTVFQLIPMPNGTWSERILHTFDSPNADGEEPECNLIFGLNGSLYGTTRRGGVNQNDNQPGGTVFEFANPDRMATPSFAPTGGIYSSAQTVHIADSFSGASIYYTTNGDNPDSSSTIYTGPIKVSASETVKAIAYGAGDTPSTVISAAYKFESPAAAPSFSPPRGTYDSAQHVILSDSTPKCVFHYTTDNSSPASSSTAYNKPIAVGQNETIKAICIAPGYLPGPVGAATYTLHLPPAAKPVFTPAGGTFATTKIVHLSSATSHAVIFYTTEHTTPFQYWTQYTSAGIKVLQSETIWAVTTGFGYSKSPQASATFTLNLPAAAAPVFNPAAGTYDWSKKFVVQLTSATPGATIYYALGKQMPDPQKGLYGYPREGLLFPAGTTTVNAVAVAPGFSESPVVSATYDLVVAKVVPPTFNPKPGTYKSGLKVTASDADPAALILYTTDGSTPTGASPLFPSGGIVLTKTETIKAIGWAYGQPLSAVSSATYTIQ